MAELDQFETETEPNQLYENGTGSNRLRAKIYQSNFEPDRIERITIPNRIEPVVGS